MVLFVPRLTFNDNFFIPSIDFFGDSYRPSFFLFSMTFFRPLI